MKTLKNVDESFAYAKMRIKVDELISKHSKISFHHFDIERIYSVSVDEMKSREIVSDLLCYNWVKSLKVIPRASVVCNNGVSSYLTCVIIEFTIEFI